LAKKAEHLYQKLLGEAMRQVGGTIPGGLSLIVSKVTLFVTLSRFISSL